MLPLAKGVPTRYPNTGTDHIGVVVLYVSVAPGVLRSPKRRVQKQQCVQSAHTYDTYDLVLKL